MRLRQACRSFADTAWSGIRIKRLNKMLVTFIALACVSCTFFPKRELNGTAEERPKIATDVLTSLHGVNAHLQTQYNAVSRGMSQSALKSLDNFVVEVSAKSTDPQKQAELLKVGFEILVDLRSAKLESVLLQQTIDAMRSTILLFDAKTLSFVQLIGRLGLSNSLALDGTLFSTANLMAKSLFTLAVVADRAGLAPVDGKFPQLSDEIIDRAKALEDKIVAMQPQMFVYLQTFLSDALNLSQKPDEFKNNLQAQANFAFDTALNGIALVNALQTQKGKGLDITTEVINNSLKSWSAVLKQASEAVAEGRTPPPPITIPDVPPVLDAQSGAMPAGFSDWIFFLVDPAQNGTVDLTKNPPVYTPSQTFGNTDSYRVRACQQIITSFCTAEKLFTVNRPQPPLAVTLRTSLGDTSLFKRGLELFCEPALRESSQQAVYAWWLQRSGEVTLTDISSQSSQAGRLTLNNIATDDRVICKVYAQTANGLRSVSPKDSNTLVAMNSAPQDIQLAFPSGQTSFPLQETALLSDGSLPPDAPSDSNRRKIADVTVTDIDPNDELADFFVTCDGLAPCPFINADRVAVSKTVSLYLKSPLNFESKATYDVALRAVDKGRPDQSYNVVGDLVKTFRMNVINMNDPITGISPAGISVQENSTKLATTLSVIDEDCSPNAACQNTNYTYELVNVPVQGLNQDKAHFEISGRSLLFAGASAPSFEDPHGPVYNLKIKMTDTSAAAGDPADVKSFIADFQVTILNVNEAPTDILLTKDDIDEELSPNTPVGLLSAADPDSGVTTFTFRGTAPLSGGCYSLTDYFEACGNQLQSRLKFNYEQLKLVLPLDTVSNKHYFEVPVTAVEQTAQAYSFTKIFKIYLNDMNDAPTNITVSKNVFQELIPETDPLSRIELSPVDVDDEAGGAQTFTFSIANVSVNGGAQQAFNPAVHPFEIQVFGDQSYLKLTRPLYYDPTVVGGQPVQDNYFQVEVVVSNARVGGSVAQSSKLIPVGVSRMTLSNAMFNENAPASTASPVKIGDLCAETGNAASSCSDWTYSLLGSSLPAGAPVTGIQVSGRELQRTKSFDFEMEPSVNVTVTATKDGVTVHKTFQVSVLDVNDNPGIIQFNPVISPADGKYYILEQEAAGTLIGTYSVTDVDSADVLDWSFMGIRPDGPTFFTLTPKAGSNFRQAELRVNTSNLPAYSPSTREEFVIRVKASDGYGVNATDATRTGTEGVDYNPFKEIKILIIQNPQLAVQSTPSAGSVFDAQTSQAVPLSIDFRISSTTPVTCVPSVWVDDPNDPDPAVGFWTAGVFISGGDAGLIQSWTSVENASSSGYEDCTLKVTPNKNKTGQTSITVSVRWETSVGMKVSTSTLSLNLAFWRPPELNCPSRISLPAGEVLSGIPCAVTFSDQSGTGVTTTVTVTAENPTCGLSLSSGLLSVSPFPSEPCSMTVTAGLVGASPLPLKNKYNSQTFSLSKTIELVPRKFSTNNTVKAMATDPAGNVYLGGSFTAVNPIPALGLTALDLRTNNGTSETPVWVYNGNRAASCNLTEGFNGVVRAIADAGDGSFWVGGDFTEYRSAQVNYLTRLTCSGERVMWHETGSGGFNGPVHSIAVSADRYVFIGGKFTTFNGASAKGVVKLDPDGVHQISFASQLPENAVVNALALTPASADKASNQTLWIGGLFSSYSSYSSIKNLVRVTQTAGLAAGFTGGVFNGEVTALSVVGSSAVFAAGTFTSYQSNSFQRIVKLDNTGTVDGPFNAGSGGFDEQVDSLANDGTALYAGGAFTSYRGAPASYLAKINLTDGTLYDSNSTPPFSNPAINGSVKSLLLMEGGSRLIVGGEFGSAGGQTHQRLALVYTSDGSVTTEFNDNLGFNGSVLALAAFDSGKKILVGGEFSAFEGSPSSRLAKFSQSGVFDSVFTAGFGAGGFNGDVETLLHSAGQEALYAGGNFTQVGSTSAGRIVKLHVPVSLGNTNTAGSPVTGFNSTAGSGFDDVVKVIKASSNDSAIYVGGRFETYAGQAAPALVRLNHAGTMDSGFNVGNGFTSLAAGMPSVNALLVVTAGTSDFIYAAGEFDRYKGNPAIRLVKLDSNGAKAPGFNVSVGASGEILALALRDSDLFAGGQFTSYAGNSSAQRLVRLNADTGELTSGGTYSLNGTVRALVTGSVGSDKFVYAGGSFSSVNSTASGPVIRIDPSTNTVSTGFVSSGTRHLNSSLTSSVNTLLFTTVTHNSNPLPLLVGGGVFSGYRNQAAPFAVRMDALSGVEATGP